MSPRAAAPGRVHGHLGGALLLRRRRRGPARGGQPGPIHVVRPLRGAARAARRARPAARGELPRPRRRERSRRPRGRRARRRRVLRQEHARDHAPPRLVGRARNARQRPRRRAVRAARRRLRLVHALHRRVPDRRARRAGDARLRALPLLLDAGAGCGSRRVPRRARGVRLRLRHLPGRLSLESRRREAARGCSAAARRRAGRLPARLARAPTATSWSTATTGSTCRGTIPDGCAGTRSSQRGMSAATLEREAVAEYATGEDELLREHAEWALARIDERGGS